MLLHDQPSKDPQAALHSTMRIQVPSSCAGWPLFPFLVNFVIICVLGVAFLPGGVAVLQCDMHFSDGRVLCF